MNIDTEQQPIYKPTLTGVLEDLFELQKFIYPILEGRLPKVRGITPSTAQREMNYIEVLDFISDRIMLLELDLSKIQEKLTALLTESNND
ncbi:hypothetical protein EDC44_10930 [Cricetibacter osteomyelitidis]|uniref:Uncharacterized protein n=1 Tax=Cricetibacter osteomyelitidis TaxID=1521931 RepID=A0A4R2TDV4_9PAST|nr:hypothetical protein [Cricetibacter osteomyelitidis]TCP95338.1 hypothetical protein EDC44_10930 [Cricetibacter osteomyelitidis]